MTSRRRLLLAIAPLGTLVGHAAGYAAGGHHDDLHGYLGPLGLSASVACVALLAWFVSGGRAERTLPSVRALLAAQVGFYVAQEVFERLLGHAPVRDLLAEPGVWWGLAAEALAAALLLLTFRAARAAAAAMLAAPRPLAFVLMRREAPAVRTGVRRAHLRAVLASERGPPGLASAR